MVASGGNPDPTQLGPTCGEAMSEFLADAGVAPADLLSEERSRTTYENAAETHRLLDRRGVKRIALVTSATHLRRSERCFRAQGFEVAPRGANYMATDLRWSIRTFLPSSSAAHTVSAATHEWIGLAWYWMHGRI